MRSSFARFKSGAPVNVHEDVRQMVFYFKRRNARCFNYGMKDAYKATLNVHDDEGQTLLHNAITLESRDIAELLIKNNALINDRDPEEGNRENETMIKFIDGVLKAENLNDLKALGYRG